jgi:hypothetical protein
MSAGSFSSALLVLLVHPLAALLHAQLLSAPAWHPPLLLWWLPHVSAVAPAEAKTAETQQDQDLALTLHHCSPELLL